VLVPYVTPGLAERALIGASVHAFSARVKHDGSLANQADLAFARQIPDPSELADSATVYALNLVWWARPDLLSRRMLIDSATALLFEHVDHISSERPYESGYRIYAKQVSHAMLCSDLDEAEADVRTLVCGVPEVDLMTARFADATVHALLLADCMTFGDPAYSAEAMRDEMIHLAFYDAA
jgi:hypothetical protein